ncbi:DUF928 domain-containing protein [Oscillatoria sp. HE19RPO]|uniref:DUF928 domain-containing protein n=1 Tax=Oscillatoria sp. HE19RPO TaxID=2954806 RepID=UPI0020C42F92|nr:DUF928 domain-containing protein [Oscillatoria sp. HE19RPO]
MNIKLIFSLKQGIARSTMIAILIMLIIPLQVLSLQKNDDNQNFEDEQRLNDVVGGGSRGACVLDSNSPRRLTALVPAKIRGGTLQEQPSLWFYSPYTQSEETQLFATFNILTDERRQFGEFMPIKLPKEPGFFKVLIAQEYPLESQNWYNWHLSIECNPQDKSQNISIQGWIARLEEENYSGDSDLIWYDRVDRLAQQLCNNPLADETLKIEWENLLNSVANDLQDNRRKFWDILIPEPLNCPLY